MPSIWNGGFSEDSDKAYDRPTLVLRFICVSRLRTMIFQFYSNTIDIQVIFSLLVLHISISELDKIRFLYLFVEIAV